MIKGSVYLESFPRGGPIGGASVSPFLFVTIHHQAAAAGEAGLEVTSVISEVTVLLSP